MSSRMSRAPRMGGAVASLALVLAACGGGEDATESPSADAARGRELFAANCAACHGEEARGTDSGPPLVHELYVPSHHGDEAFQVAAARGVQPHHWDFGAMPPVEGVSRGDVEDIVAYVRGLQREAGLIE